MPIENEKVNNLNEYIEMNKRISELYYQTLLEYKNQLDLVQSTKSWKMMCLLRKFNEQILKGNYAEKKKFLMWFIQKGLKKQIIKDLELGQYSPIKPIDTKEYKIPELEVDHTNSEIQSKKLNKIVPGKVDVFRFPVIDWNFRWQRPQQISIQFVKNGYRVFYFSIDTHGMKSQNAIYEDISKQTVVKELQNNVYWVKLCTVQPLNAYRDQINEQDLIYMQWSIESIKRKFNINATYSILDLPFWSKLAFTLPNNIVMYDCMDDHEGFSTNSLEMLSQEKKLIQSSDIVFASSQRLFEKLIKQNPKTLLVRNAGEYEHFSKIPNEFPENIKGIKGPIIGYYGAISEWFDIKLVEQLAKRNDNWTFVLVGNTFGCDISSVEKLENVIFTGEVPYRDLPGYLHKFDVCLIPFLINNLTLATNPVKIYEYLAAGKPVVSSLLPELEYMSELIYLAESLTGFEKSIRSALVEDENEMILKRKDYAAKNTWYERYKQIEGSIMKDFPKVSIVIVTYNNWGFTKQCLDSLFTHNEYPNIEIIIVDNNSSDETRVNLAKINHPNVKIALSSENLGFAGGNNLGCKLSTGEYLILLNNDTIVTPNWIETIIKPLRENNELGMAGPVSNSVGNDQMLDFFIGDSLDGPSKEWLKDFKSFFKGKYRYTNLLGFYCVAIKKEVYKKAGDLDTNYGIGMFEDDDYCEMVKSLGYKLAIVEDAFVFHHGSVSFKKINSEEYKKIWEKNMAYFESKWNIKWSIPKPPVTIFAGVLDPNDIAKIVKENKHLSPILIAGEWNNEKGNRMKEFVLKVSNNLDNLVFVYSEKYNGENYHGLRRAGSNVYFTNKIDYISKVEFKKAITFKYDVGLKKIQAKMAYANNKMLNDLKIDLMEEQFLHLNLEKDFDHLFRTEEIKVL